MWKVSLGGAIVPAQMSMVAKGGAPDVEYNTENVSTTAHLCSGFSSPLTQNTVKIFFFNAHWDLSEDCKHTDKP